MAIFFILGLAVGSFVNALVYRLHEGVTLGGRSFCPRCKKPIFWHDNIPLLSFFVLRGRCRSCREKISYGYPTVELLTGFVFAAIGYFFFNPETQNSWIQTVYLLTLCTLLIALAVYDFSYMEIPLVLVAIGGGLAILYLGFSSLGVAPWWASPLISGLTGGFALSFFFFFLVFFSRETWMGWGDVWIGFLGGLIVGLPYILFLLTLSSLLGAGVGTAGILLGKKTMKSAVPFAPFLVVGIMGTVFMKELGLRLPPVLFSLISW